MTTEKLFHDFIYGKFVIHCKTLEERFSIIEYVISSGHVASTTFAAKGYKAEDWPYLICHHNDNGTLSFSLYSQRPIGLDCVGYEQFMVHFYKEDEAILGLEDLL